MSRTVTGLPHPKSDAVLAYLTEIAEIGEQCPAVVALKARFNVAQTTMHAIMDDLAGAGFISMVTKTKGREVTIAATGKSTKPVGGAVMRSVIRPEPAVRRPSSAPPKESPEDKVLRIAREVRATRLAAPDAVDPIQARLRDHAVQVAPEPAVAPVEEPVIVETPAAAAEAPMNGKQGRIVAIDENDPEEDLEAIADAVDADERGVWTPGLCADMEYQDGELVLTVWMAADRRHPRSYRPFLSVPLDEGHATELLGTTAIALRDFRQSQRQPGAQ